MRGSTRDRKSTHRAASTIKLVGESEHMFFVRVLPTFVEPTFRNGAISLISNQGTYKKRTRSH